MSKVSKWAKVKWHPISALVPFMYLLFSIQENGITTLRIIVIITVFIWLVLSIYNLLSKNKFLNWLYSELEENMSKKGSFTDMLRNPIGMENFAEYFQKVDDLAAEISSSKKLSRNFVDEFVFNNAYAENSTSYKILIQLDNKVFQRAIEILSDDSLHDKLMVKDSLEDNHNTGTSGMERLLSIFLSVPNLSLPEKNIELIAPLFDYDDSDVIKKGLCVIAETGSLLAIPYLNRAMQGYTKDTELIESISYHIQKTIKHGRIDTHGKKRSFYQVLEDYYKNNSHLIGFSLIFEAMVDLSPEKAVEFFIQDDVFKIKNYSIYKILRALSKGKANVPRERVIAIMQDAIRESKDTEKLDWTTKQILKYSLALLGGRYNKKDLALLMEMLEHPCEEISMGAIKGLKRHYKYDKLIRDYWDVFEKNGWDSLTEAEKNIIALEMLDEEIDNGGFEQYFFNSSGDYWQNALNGLDAIGATKHKNVFVKVIEKFGKSSPSKNCSDRREQLATIINENEDIFEKETSVWYKNETELLQPLIFKYNINNLEGRSQNCN